MCVSIFLAHYPGIEVTVRGTLGRADCRRLARGTLDLGMAYRPPTRTELWFEPLYTKSCGWWWRPRTRWRAAAACAWSSCTGWRMVLLPRVLHAQLLDECFEAAGAEPRWSRS